MTLIDTHCHLNDQEAFPDPSAAVHEAVDAGVKKLIVIGVNTSSSQYAVELAENYQEVYAAVGWHPNESSRFNTKELIKIEELLKHPKVLGVGEIGLDFYRNYASQESQEVCFLSQLELALKFDKSVVLHCRNAYPEVLTLLELRPNRKLLFHCFAGTFEDAKRAISLDAYFGVDGPITYKKAEELRAVIKTLPQDRLLLETDSPWLTPYPFRGKSNKPALLSYVNEGLADTLRISEEECASLTTRNAKDFFGLDAK